MNESFPPIPPEETNEEGGALSRRSFLRKAAGATLGAATMTGTLGLLKEQPANATEVREGMTFAEGIQALREDIRRSPVETSALFVEHPDRSYWTFPADGEKKTTKGDPRPVIARESQAGATRIKRAHTHPFSAAAEILNTEGEQGWQEGIRMPRLAPSVDDIQSAAILAASFPQVHFEEWPLDPHGAWTIHCEEACTLGKDRIEMHGIQTTLGVARKQMQEYFGDTWEVEFQKMAGDMSYAQELFGETRGQNVHSLASRAIALDEQYQNKYRPALEEIDACRRAVLDASVAGQDTEEPTRALIEAAAKINITITFTPYDKIADPVS